MLATRLRRQHLWGVVSLCLMAGVVMWGCAAQESPHPQQPPPDVSKPLAALEECIIRSQGAVKAATETGVSAGPLAPINSGIADAQDAVDEGKKLAQQGQQQAAAERLTKAREECDKLGATLAQARQDATERKVRAQMASEADIHIARTVTCIDGAHQSLRRANAAGVRGGEITAAKRALDNAETGLKQARDLLVQNDSTGTVERLQAALADCQTAREMSDKTTASRLSPTRPRRGR